MKRDEKEANVCYNNLAKEYHALRTKKGGWFYNELLEMPATLELLGKVKGKKILDFGCGTGIYAKKLTQKGARVYGFDVSEEMLGIAKKHAPKVTFKLGSGYNIPFNEKFDIVLASLVLDYFEDWNKVFRQVNKVLKSGGLFIFSIGNPIAECKKNVKINGKTFRVLTDYFTEKKIYTTWKFDNGKSMKVQSYHKTYETVMKTIFKNKFEIVGYKDAFPLKSGKKLFSRDYKIFSKIPYFCVWKVKKS